MSIITGSMSNGLEALSRDSLHNMSASTNQLKDNNQLTVVDLIICAVFLIAAADVSKLGTRRQRRRFRTCVRDHEI